MSIWRPRVSGWISSQKKYFSRLYDNRIVFVSSTMQTQNCNYENCWWTFLFILSIFQWGFLVSNTRGSHISKISTIFFLSDHIGLCWCFSQSIGGDSVFGRFPCICNHAIRKCAHVRINNASAAFWVAGVLFFTITFFFYLWWCFAQCLYFTRLSIDTMVRNY